VAFPLKPNTIGAPVWHDDVREYLEIAVPYTVLLLINAHQRLSVSLAHKRWVQNEADKVVLAWQVSQYTDIFKLKNSLQRLSDKREKLQKLERLAADTISLRSRLN